MSHFDNKKSTAENDYRHLRMLSIALPHLIIMFKENWKLVQEVGSASRSQASPLHGF